MLCGCDCGCSGADGWDCGCDGADGWDCGCDGAGDGACEGPCKPRSPALAGAGIRGIDEPPRATVAPAPDVDSLATRDPDARECPGATADTRAAIPAVSAAAAAITQRRADTTRASAASRASAALDFDDPTCPILELIVPERESTPCKSSMRIGRSQRRQLQRERRPLDPHGSPVPRRDRRHDR
jgi:hypothetical protein